MKKLPLFSVLMSSLALLAAGSSQQALAQGAFPQREVTIVVPFNPGGVSGVIGHRVSWREIIRK